MKYYKQNNSKIINSITVLFLLMLTSLVNASDVKQIKHLNISNYKDVVNTKKVRTKILNTFKMRNDLRVEEFGTIASGSELTITINENDLSVLVSGNISDNQEFVVVTDIVDPDGKNIYHAEIDNNGEVTITSTITNEIIGNNGEFGLFFPLFTNIDGILKVGNYKITVITESNSNISNVKAVFKTKTNQNQKIDFNFLVIDRNENFTNEAYLVEFFTSITLELNEMLNPHGISVGQLNYKVANNEIAQQFAEVIETSVIDVCNLISQEFGNTRAMNIGFVEMLYNGQAAGIATASPGSVFDTNATNTCVLASQRVYGDKVHLHAANFLHETGHYISFPHTTEGIGTVFDFFTDTPECDLATYDSNNDGNVDDFECGFEGGADNFMFYSGVIEYSPFKVSQQQASIMKAHPYFYPDQANDFNIVPSITGAWYNPSQSGHGFFIEVISDTRMLATWYVFDEFGNQQWLIADGSFIGNTASLEVTLVENGLFPPLFNAENITRKPWGTLVFEFSDCDNSEVSWNSNPENGSLSGNLALKRLTSIASLTCNSSK